jgi:parallel beta-helix repeat protein
MASTNSKIWYVPSDYSTIDQAITVSSPGDTIEVATGTYEGFTIDRSVTIKGSGIGQTIISSPVIVKGTSNVDISYLSLNNHLGTRGYSWAIEIRNSQDITVSKCQIKAGEGGIFVFFSQGCIISQNDIEFCTSGFLIASGISSAGISVYAEVFTSASISLHDNAIKTSALQPNGIDISGIKASIVNNEIFTVANAITINSQSNECTISGNVLSSSNEAISVNSQENQILSNTISSAKTGISINTDENVIAGNKVSQGTSGIRIIGDGNRLFFNSLTSLEEGVYINGQFNKISKNNFFSNSVQAHDDGIAATNVWYLNGFGNYWSDMSAPDSNNDGIVDKPYPVQGSARSVDKYPLTKATSFTLNDLTSLNPPSISPTPSPIHIEPSPSIPEFPSMIILSALFVAILVILICYRKRTLIN